MRKDACYRPRGGEELNPREREKREKEKREGERISMMMRGGGVGSSRKGVLDGAMRVRRIRGNDCRQESTGGGHSMQAGKAR